MDFSFLKTALPTIASALGGPFAGLAAGFIADKLGVSDKTVSNISEVLQKASMDPNQLLELKRVDIEFKKYLAQMEINLEEIAARDRDSARQREMTVKDGTPRNLAYGITIGFFGILGYLILKGFPEGNKDIIIYLLGSLSTAWTSVMAYYYGSTKGSADKTAMLANNLNRSKEES